MRVQRRDAGSFTGPTRTPQGGVRVDAMIARCGVLSYSDSAGNSWRELRLPEEVFAPEALASFNSAPVSEDHPPALVTEQNWREYAVGHACDDVRPSGAFVRATLVVQSGPQVEQLLSGALKEVSCGYSCELEHSPGVTPEGEAYEYIQRSIRGNHIALGPPGWGRSGAEVSVRLNDASVTEHPRAIAIEKLNPGASPGPTTRADSRGSDGDSMEKWITIRGRKFKLDAAEDQSAGQAAVDQEMKRGDDAASSAASLQKLADDLTAAINALKAQPPANEPPAAPAMTELGAEGLLDSIQSKHPRVYAKHLAKTVQDHSDARLVLGAEAKLDGLGREEIDRRIVEKQYGVKADTKLDAQYLRGMAQGAIESARKATTKTDSATAPEMHPVAQKLEQELATKATHTDGHEQDPDKKLEARREAARKAAL